MRYLRAYGFLGGGVLCLLLPRTAVREDPSLVADDDAVGRNGVPAVLAEGAAIDLPFA